MVRTILTTYLALFTAAGPSLCCCTTLSWFVAGSSAQKCSAGPTCCTARPRTCGCGAADAGTGCCSKSFPAPSPQRVPGPCKDLPDTCCFTTAPFTAPAELSPVRWAVQLAQDLPAVDAALTPLTTPCLTACAALSLGEPFWPPADLLHVHHRLRC